MQITNEKVAFLGDSITVGHAAYPVKEFAYFALFRQKYPDAKFYNFGHSGSCIGRTHECQGEKWNQDFITRAQDLPDDLDLVVVYGGTNDFGHGSEPTMPCCSHPDYKPTEEQMRLYLKELEK